MVHNSLRKLFSWAESVDVIEENNFNYNCQIFCIFQIYTYSVKAEFNLMLLSRLTDEMMKSFQRRCLETLVAT